MFPFDAQQLGQPQHHASLVGAPGGELQQMIAGEDQLIVLRPAPLSQILPDPGQHRHLLFKEQLGAGLGNGPKVRHLPVRRMGQMLVFFRPVVGLDGVDVVALVVDLTAHGGEGLEDLHAPVPDYIVQQSGVDVPVRLKVIEPGAVAHHPRRIHGHLVHKAAEGRQRPAGGDGKAAAIGHEIAQGLPVPLGHLGHGGALTQGVLGPHQGVVKIAGQQHAVKFSHG